jgi:hypothetical protein
VTLLIQSNINRIEMRIVQTNHSKCALRNTKQKSGKAFPAMDCTSIGSESGLKFVNENPSDSIRRNDERDTIEGNENDSHSLKQEEPKISTVLGMMKDGREEWENAEDLIHYHTEFDSMELDESRSQQRK